MCLHQPDGMYTPHTHSGCHMHPCRAASTAAAPAVLPSEPVYIAIEEKLSVALNKDGGLENMEVQGTMSLQVGGGQGSLSLRVGG